MIYSCNSAYRLRYWNHCNELQQRLWTRRCNSAYRLRYWNLTHLLHLANLLHVATVLTACGIETFAEPVMAMITLAVATVLTACGIETMVNLLAKWWLATVATVLTACGMRRRVRGSRGAKRRWGPHISSPWPKGRENKGDEATVLTACGIETLDDRYLLPEMVNQLQQCLPLAVLKLTTFICLN